MENFKIDNPTILHFGNDVIADLGKTITLYGKNILLIYGGGSIKKNGIYNDIIQQLDSIKANVFEYSGIKPNPLVEDVDKAAEVGRRNNVDLVLAVGGGSVIDSAKLIALAIPQLDSAWEFMEQRSKPTQAVPIISVLTLAATGTEMNPYAVVQNPTLKKKLGYGHPLMYPKHSFLDPCYTFSVSKEYTAYGIVDLVAHALENYFGKGEATLSDRFVFSIIREAVEFGPALLENLSDYELRAKIMYAATMALNGLTANGRVSGDWGVHSLGHILSVLFDTAHGATLSIAYPAWLKFIKEQNPQRIEKLGQEVFGVETADETIAQFELFFRKLESPVLMSDAGISKDEKAIIIQTMVDNKVGGMHFNLNERDIYQLVELMYNG